MADNVEAASGSGGPTFATDDDGVAHHPYTKIEWGADNTQTKVNTGAGALPTQGAAAENAAATANPNLVGGRYDATPRTLGDGDVGAIALDSDGAVHISDGGNAITVDGTVTANLSATDNAVLDNIQTAVELIDNAISGNEMQVDVVAALPAGTNAIGKLAANSGVDIGDVDVLSIIPGTGASNLGKAEDAAHTSGDVGVMALSVRTNTATARAGTDGDYQPLITDTNGRLHVKLLANESVNVGQMNGTAVTMGNGASGTGVQRVTLASDSTGQVKLTTGTSGGTTIFRSIDLDESEEEVKASAGQVYWIHCMNLSASKVFLKFYNATAATVVVGTTTPVLTFPIPTQGDTNGAGFTLAIPNGIAFGTAITVAATTGIADSDTGAPGANEVVLNMGYA